MARIAGVNIPLNKRVEVGLTYIYGVGEATARKVLQDAGIDPDTYVKNLTDDEVSRVRDYLISHTDQFRSYTQSDPDTVNLLKSREVVLSDGGRGTALQAERAGVPVNWVAPKERPLSWICGLGIPAHSANLPAAYKMINYYTSPPTQAQSARAGYVVTNPAALPLVPAAYKATANPAT